MEEILKKANELGLMIKGTELVMRYEELSQKLDKDKESSELLEEYIKVVQEFQQKEDEGSPIEVNEKEMITELNTKISGNSLIKEYIASQSYYVNMMMQIQKAISEPEGDPIRESRIITPNKASKIITSI
jgi:cell fate (sporulation/competence/biofilm development) regulator YlbF (YheA/YmcA/DUF963 family)